MADEIIDLRDRIEKMRIEIENEGTEQVSIDSPLQTHQKTSNSNTVSYTHLTLPTTSRV